MTERKFNAANSFALHFIRDNDNQSEALDTDATGLVSIQLKVPNLVLLICSTFVLKRPSAPRAVDR